MKKAADPGAGPPIFPLWVAGKRVADRQVKSAPQPRKPLPGRGSAIFPASGSPRSDAD